MSVRSWLAALLLVPLAVLAAESSPEPLTIDQLLASVRDSVARQERAQADREAKFLANRDERAALLADVKLKRQAAEREADRLAAEFEQGERELADLETRLFEETGDLNDVFAVVREVAGDVLPLVEGSLVSAEIRDRRPLLERLARADVTPTSAELRELWLLLLGEMTASGKTARFDGPVISSSGEESVRTVTRVGSFTALSDGEYLRFLPETGRLLALPRQPIQVNPADVEAFEAGDGNLSVLPIDPSRGSILALVVQRTELVERVQQGGVIGYVILVIGVIGLLLALERALVVLLGLRRLKSEIEGAEAGGPVARLRAAAGEPELTGNVDALSSRMDEIVATENQRLGRGLPTLSIFAAVSPLLGLLGTVTGMIETFQVITLFGAGDPRLMSGGISQALITTQLGLAVAIPLLLLHSFVQGRVNSQVAILDETAAHLFANAVAVARDD